MTDYTQSTRSSPDRLTPRTSMDSNATFNRVAEAIVTMSDLQEQIRHLRASVDSLISTSGYSKPNIDSLDRYLCDTKSVIIYPGLLTPPESPLPHVKQPEDETSYLYTISGTLESYCVFACSHCAPGEVLVSEGFVEEMQAKIKSMADRGYDAVQGRIEAQRQLSLTKKQCAQLAKRMSSTEQKSRTLKIGLHQQALKAEKAKNLAEQVNADMLGHWNASLWEVATLKAHVQQLERQMKLESDACSTAEREATVLRSQVEVIEKDAASRIHSLEQRINLSSAAKNQLQEQLMREIAAKTAAENEIAALKPRLSSAADAVTTLTREPSGQQDILNATRKHLEAQITREVDARTAAERESEILLKRMYEAATQSNIYADTNNRLETEILELTREEKRLVAVDLARMQSHCDALEIAKNSDALRMEALEQRNTYLEERLSVYGETRWTTSADTGLLSDDMSTPPRGQGQSWGFGSLRGLRRRGGGEEERVSLEDLV